MLWFPPYYLDVKEEQLFKSGVEVRLRRKPFAVLTYLAERPGQLVRHEELVEGVWGKVVMSASALRSHVSEVRQAVGEDRVETVIGRGYRFLGEVSNIETAQGCAVVPPDKVDHPPFGAAFVDRDAELARLHATAASARAGRRQIVFVSGEAGIGKTMLVDAFLARLEAEGNVASAWGPCVEQYGSGEAYLSILAAIAKLCVAADGARVIELLSLNAPSWLAHVPTSATRQRAAELSAATEARGSLGALSARLLHELAEALEAISTDRLVVLALDDLQWGDPSTIELLAFLARRREAARLLVIGTYRPANLPKLHPLARVASELIVHKQALDIPLAAFSAATTAAYVDIRFARHDWPLELAVSVHETTGGNPLFLATLFDDLELRQVIRCVDGRWNLATTVGEVASHRPDSITRLLDIQLDRLDVRMQRIVEAAAVAGMTFTAGVVAYALDLPVDEVDSACESLAQTHRLIRARGTEAWPDGTIQSKYGFAHALWQHAALARAASARMLHRRIGAMLEAAHAGQALAIAPQLAVHFREGLVLDRAAHYYVLAGEGAARRSGSFEALEHFSRAERMTALLAESAERDELELRALHGLGWSLFETAQIESIDVVPVLERAAALAARMNRFDELGESLVRMQKRRVIEGKLKEVSEHAEEVARVAERCKDPATLHEAMRIGAISLTFQARYQEADTQLRAHCSLFDAQCGSAKCLDARGELAHVVWLMGRPDEALQWARDALRSAQASGSDFALCKELYNLALIHTWRGDDDDLHTCAERLLSMAEKKHFPMWRTCASLFVHSARSNLAPHDRTVKRYVDLTDPPFVNMGWCTIFVEICARAGAVERGLAVIDEALRVSQTHSQRAREPELHRLRGELLARTDRTGAATSFGYAFSLAKQQSSLSLQLRAALSIHRFNGASDDATSLDELRRTHSCFVEGFDTKDLRDATRILAAAGDGASRAEFVARK